MSRYSGEDSPKEDARGEDRPVCDVITPKEHDLGGFQVRRVLPAPARRMVGPFIFFDHIGPATFPPGKGVDVRPHPHIGLATLTWLFDGSLHHKDSLGSDLSIRPGALNWMTAGHGIVHSERTGEPDRSAGHDLHGIQSWVALPEEAEDTNPGFDHYPPERMPRIDADGVRMLLIAGSAFGETSPARTFSPLFYLQADMEAGAALTLPAELGERAFYVVEGEVAVGDETFGPRNMVVLADGRTPTIRAQEASRLMLLGGAPVGPRKIWWNLVASDPARIEAAKADWTTAAETDFPANGRFPMPPGEEEYIPLPEDQR